MELRQLRYFVKVCELRSMGRAALELDLATSALSQQISRLEGELSTRLLRRSSTGVTPTDAGIGELVASYFLAPPTALPQVEAGRLVALATTGSNRPLYMPDIPTVAESGYPGFEALNWYAFVAPGKTPAPILDRWNREIVKASCANARSRPSRRIGRLPT